MSQSEDDSARAAGRGVSDTFLIVGGVIWAACAVGAAVLHTHGYVPWWVVALIIFGAGLSGMWIRRRRR